jgi:hypothetical protein
LRVDHEAGQQAMVARHPHSLAVALVGNQAPEVVRVSKDAGGVNDKCYIERSRKENELAGSFREMFGRRAQDL